MKKNVFIVIVALMLFTIGCNTNPKKLIVNNWKVTKIIEGNDVKEGPLLDVMNLRWEFTKDGFCTMKTGSTTNWTATYTLSEDGKKLGVLNNGEWGGFEIIELSASKFQLKSEKDITFIMEHE